MSDSPISMSGKGSSRSGTGGEVRVSDGWSCREMLIIEPRQASARRAAYSAFLSAIPALVLNLGWAHRDPELAPDIDLATEEDRIAFGNRVVADYMGNVYHQYSIMYSAFESAELI